MSKDVKSYVVTYVHPGSRSDSCGWFETVEKASGDCRVEINCVPIDNCEQTIEQALFVISNEMDEPHLIVILDYEAEGYGVKNLSERFRYHFPKTGIMMVTENAGQRVEESFGIYECLDYVLFKEHVGDIALLAAGYYGVSGHDAVEHVFRSNKAASRQPLKSDAATLFVRKKSDHEFGSFSINAPVAPRSLANGESVAEILARPRKPARVLLVYPPQMHAYGVKQQPAYPPLGLLTIGAILEKAGHVVKLIDMDAEDVGTETLIKAVSDGGFDIVGFSSVTPSYPVALDIASAVKREFPAITTILGGIHATVDPHSCAKESAFDFIVVGEGECTAVELVDAVILKAGDFSGVKGLVYTKMDGSMVATEMRSLVPDLDDLPFPAMHLLKDIDRYSPPDATSLPVMPIMVSRGCPGQCTYCQTKNIFGRRTRYRSPEKVMEYVRELHDRYGIRELHIIDDVFTANRRIVMDFCRLLKAEPYKLHIALPNGVRADMISEEILQALKEAGLRAVGFGVETGSDRIAKIIRKGMTRGQVRKAFAMAKKVGLDTWGFFMIGLPGDDERSVQDTIDFAIELNPKFAKFLILKPFPGSEVFYQLNEKGLIDSFDYFMYGVYTAPVHHLEALTQQRILQMQKKAFRSFYFRPSKIFEHLRGLKSRDNLVTSMKGLSFVLANAFKR